MGYLGIIALISSSSASLYWRLTSCFLLSSCNNGTKPCKKKTSLYTLHFKSFHRITELRKSVFTIQTHYGKLLYMFSFFWGGGGARIGDGVVTVILTSLHVTPPHTHTHIFFINNNMKLTGKESRKESLGPRE